MWGGGRGTYKGVTDPQMVHEALWQQEQVQRPALPAWGTWREKVTGSGGEKHSEGTGTCEHECCVQMVL